MCGEVLGGRSWAILPALDLVFFAPVVEAEGGMSNFLHLLFYEW